MKYEEFEKIKHEITEVVNQEVPAGSCRIRVKEKAKRLKEALNGLDTSRTENSKYIIYTQNVNLGTKKWSDCYREVFVKKMEGMKETTSTFSDCWTRIYKCNVIGYLD